MSEQEKKAFSLYLEPEMKNEIEIIIQAPFEPVTTVFLVAVKIFVIKWLVERPARFWPNAASVSRYGVNAMNLVTGIKISLTKTAAYKAGTSSDQDFFHSQSNPEKLVPTHPNKHSNIFYEY